MDEKRITKAEFMISAGMAGGFPDHEYGEIAVCGKSNVGKSSLINCLANRHGLARTSGVPGKTRLVNYFLLNGEFLLVDLPGYGYAKAPKSEQQKWSELMQRYFEQADTLRLFLWLLDIRHPPTALDKQMLSYLLHYGYPFCIVATKADKIAKSKRPLAAAMIRKELRLKEMAIPVEIIPFSSTDKTGREDVLKAVFGALEKE